MDIKNYTYNHYLDGEAGILDSHVHLGSFPYSKEFADAVNEGEIKALSFGLKPSAYKKDKKLEGPMIKCGLGFHPWEVGDNNNDEIKEFDTMFESAMLIGEIGLDFSKKRKDTKLYQLEVFEHIAKLLGNSHSKTISIHCCKSFDAIVDILKEYKVFQKEHTIIFHWFNGTRQQLMDAIKLGCYFSVGPKMAATSNGYTLIQDIPDDRLLIETDLP